MSRTRQRLLFLAIVGLVISSFALLVLQSTMGGLQEKLIGRSKMVLGEYLLQFPPVDAKSVQKLKKRLDGDKIAYLGEYEIELLLKAGPRMAPALVHGISPQWGTPGFVPGSINGAMVPYEIAHEVRVSTGEEIELISPSHVDSFLGDVPRSIHVDVEDVISTDVPEVDALHIWVKLSKIQNLVRAAHINRIRIFTPGLTRENLMAYGPDFPEGTRVLSWEDQNTSLVYALRLETSVMVFLFIMMTVLVSLCITSGLMIFFNKVKVDLSSFWVLGADRTTLYKNSSVLLAMISFGSVVCGLVLAGTFLFVLDRFGIEIMPDVFVDRKIPVRVTLGGVAVSFFVPLVVSLLFGAFSLVQFRRGHDPMEQIRSVS